MGHLSDQQKIEAVYRYQNENVNCGDLAREYGCRPCSIWAMLKRRGVKIRKNNHFYRKFNINENFFKKIDNEVKAYILGLLYADGCNKESGNIVVLSLAESDKNILEKINLAIDSDSPLKLIKKRSSNHQNQIRLQMCSREICRDLSKLGCGEAKTFSLEFPAANQVPNHLLHHFVRGFFDGDGCYYIQLIGGVITKYEISVVSTESFCSSLQNLIKEFLQINSYLKTRHPERKHNIRTLKFCGRLQTQKFLNWIYKDASIYLDRKYEKYARHKTIMEDKRLMVGEKRLRYRNSAEPQSSPAEHAIAI